MTPSITPSYILAIDQGTTSSRAFLFDQDMKVCETAQREFEQHFPDSGWVEHDAEDIWKTVLDTCHEVILKANIDVQHIKGIGITNQRETVVAWHRETLEPIYNAIVWQDRRTTEFCVALQQKGLEQTIQQKTGLLIDPYFSASKMQWMLENVPQAQLLLKQNLLCFGTIDSYLMAKFSGGEHLTDVTNASRTQLFNIHDLKWDQELADIFNIPLTTLPSVKACDELFTHTMPSIFGRSIPICGVAGDQQAALIGQRCFDVGQIKSTYGTGCFALLNTGKNAVISTNRLLTTIAYQIDGEVIYALEGSIFVAGAAIQWLRDGLKIISSAHDSEKCAKNADPHQRLFLVPAFTGLGAPYWNADVRGALFGITRATGENEICKAALESIVYQSFDLFSAMRNDMQASDVLNELGHHTKEVRVDGGMVANDWLMQFLADILNRRIEKPKALETTVLGAAYLAGKSLGIYGTVEAFSKQVVLEEFFEPQQHDAWRQDRLTAWKSAVDSTLNFHS